MAATVTSKGQVRFARLRGHAGKGLSTDEIMAMTRGERWGDPRRHERPARSRHRRSRLGHTIEFSRLHSGGVGGRSSSCAKYTIVNIR